MTKLSEIKGEKVLDIIADLIEPVANIAMDEEAAAIFKPEGLPEGMTAGEFMVTQLKKSVPKLLKTHREDIITIMSTLMEVDRKEYVKNMTITSVAQDFLALLGDKEVRSFFY